MRWPQPSSRPSNPIAPSGLARVEVGAEVDGPKPPFRIGPLNLPLKLFFSD